MICQAISQLDQVHALFKSHNDSLDPRDVYPLLRDFRESASNHAENIHPDDSASADLKALYLSEEEAWGYLWTLFESTQGFKAFFDHQKPEKFSFFTIFNPKVSQAFQQKDLNILDGLRVDNAYLGRDFSSDLSVINDILSFDEILWTLHSLVESLPGAEQPDLRDIRMGEVEDYKEVSRMAEWDFMGARDPKACETFTKADNSLYQEVFGWLRRGRVNEAQEALLGRNRYVFAANLNSGLAYHDFSQMDREIMEVRAEKKEEPGLLGQFQGNQRGVLVESAKEYTPKVLDFMVCRDFLEVMAERRTFYLSLVP